MVPLQGWLAVSVPQQQQAARGRAQRQRPQKLFLPTHVVNLQPTPRHHQSTTGTSNQDSRAAHSTQRTLFTEGTLKADNTGLALCFPSLTPSVFHALSLLLPRAGSITDTLGLTPNSTVWIWEPSTLHHPPSPQKPKYSRARIQYSTDSTTYPAALPAPTSALSAQHTGTAKACETTFLPPSLHHRTFLPRPHPPPSLCFSVSKGDFLDTGKTRGKSCRLPQRPQRHCLLTRITIIPIIPIHISRTRPLLPPALRTDSQRTQSSLLPHPQRRRDCPQHTPTRRASPILPLLLRATPVQMA